VSELLLFDDLRARGWHPFADTRPVGELRCGAYLVRERAERCFGTPCAGHLTGPALDGWDEPGAPPALDLRRLDRRGDGASAGRILWLSRALARGPVVEPGDAPRTLVAGDTVVGWWLPPDAEPPDADALSRPGSLDVGSPLEVDARVLEWPWDLVRVNADVLREDLDRAGHRDAFQLHPGVHLEGTGGVSLGDASEVGPGVVIDAREGPVRIDDGAIVQGPARLVGPLHIGPGSIVFGGHVERASVGPVCKLRGEIADTVFVGYANKAHDGYLGHALVGRWVNLGAGTTNSDLKNNYGPVRVRLPDGDHDTGLTKVGSFLGDHVKTGIGTLLTTGGVIGAGTNVFGGAGVPPRHVPPFAWGGGGEFVPYRWDKFVETARSVMARREQELTPGVEGVLHRLWQETHGATP
jgi:UDP-N-acetylglucosamine diphosphorylase/glucosamine-1-phosphate N-acetyltransferase